MRLRFVAPAIVTTILAAGLGGQAALASSRNSAYDRNVRDLEATWTADVAAGVPATAIDPLRTRLASANRPQLWSSDWWRDTPEQVIAALRSQTQEVWDTALADARDRADIVLAAAHDLVATGRGMVPDPFVAGVSLWPQQIGDAATPAAVTTLAARYSAELADARSQTHAAQIAAAKQAEALAQAAKVRRYGGVLSLLDTAGKLDQVASDDNLDISAVDALAAQAQQLVDANQDATAVGARLSDAIAAFQAVVSQNDQIAAAMEPLQWEIQQAVVEGTPSAAAFQTQFQPLEGAFTSARTADQIGAVLQQQSTLKAAVDAELGADACGHAVPPGKVLVVSLSEQEMVVYQDGCAVRATPVTTGRPALPTPAGTYHVFYKTTPFTMVSPWPKPSPFWYPTTTVTWVMEFLGGGYFIHDAAWESPSAYGRGSEDNPYAASHGCIHIPTATMQWLYSWTPVGTEVIVEA